MIRYANDTDSDFNEPTNEDAHLEASYEDANGGDFDTSADFDYTIWEDEDDEEFFGGDVNCESDGSTGPSWDDWSGESD